MSESSLPHAGSYGLRNLLKTLRPPRLKGMLGRLRTRSVPARSPVLLESLAEEAIREHLEAYAETLDRAVRLREKAERLEKSGTPSESAVNRARRAHTEVAAVITVLRTSFVEAAENEDAAARAFDLAAGLVCPDFATV